LRTGYITTAVAMPEITRPTSKNAPSSMRVSAPVLRMKLASLSSGS
jgi:hypothetical protein